MISFSFPLGGGSIGSLAARPVHITGYQGHPIPIEKLLPQNESLLPYASVINDQQIYIGIPMKVITKLSSHLFAKNGFPHEMTGQFYRMLYLSTITITTLGYGDIVPLSHAARFWVGTQSILGILIIGLFLNALTLGIAGITEVKKN